MANLFLYNNNKFQVGDTLDINYKIKGDSQANRMITVRKITRSGIGVERVLPLSSPFIASIKLTKKSNFRKAKLYFIRELSDKELRHKLYQVKSKVKTANK